MPTVIVRLEINDEELATLKAYAATGADIGMTWRHVARGWAWGGLRDGIATFRRRLEMTPQQRSEYESLNRLWEE